MRSSRSGDVLVVELHRPDRLHALNTPLLSRLIDTLAAARDEPGVAALVVTGSGGCFSSGADVAEDLDHTAALSRMELFGQLYEALSVFPRPAVAAVDGWCIGGGAELACACDLRVATPAARFRFPGASFGIPAGAARLPLLVGMSHAKDLLMTARTVSGQEGYRLGLVNRLVAPQELLAAAVGEATAMAANPGAGALKEALHREAALAERTRRENEALVAWQQQAKGLMGQDTG